MISQTMWHLSCMNWHATLVKKPKITVYVDGPFYPKPELHGKEQEIELRNQIYNCMVERSKNSTYEYYKYYKRVEKND